MVRTLATTSGESLLPDVLATGKQAAGFSARDVTLWVDQARLNKSRYFINYWIYHNTSEKDANSLSNIESGLVDLSFAADGLRERRWFVLKKVDGAQPDSKTMTAEQTSALMRFAPSGVGMVEVNGPPRSNQELGDAVSGALFGKLPDDAATAAGTPSNDDSAPHGHGEGRTDRYSTLDQRFDMDVDDDSLQPAAGLGPNAPSGSSTTGPKTSGNPGGIAIDPAKRFGKSIAPILAAISPAGYCDMVRTRVDQGKPFVAFERAVVIEMKADAAVDRAALERTIADEFRSRFVIAGVAPAVGWQDEASVRCLSQSLLEQGASYSVSGKYLILTSSKDFARDILRAAETPTSPRTAKTSLSGPADLYAVVHIADAKSVFDKLMSKLDRQDDQSANTGGAADNNDADNNEAQTPTETSDTSERKDVKFFSGNISSLIKASGIREMTVQRATTGSLMTEQVNYLW